MAKVELDSTPDDLTIKIKWEEKDKPMSFLPATPKKQLWNIVGIAIIVIQVILISYFMFF